MEVVEPMSDMVKNMIFKTCGKKNMRFLKWGKLESKQNWSKLKQSFDSSCKNDVGRVFVGDRTLILWMSL